MEKLKVSVIPQINQDGLIFFFDWYCYCESNFVCIQSNIEGYYPKEEISEVDESEVRKVVTKYIR